MAERIFFPFFLLAMPRSLCGVSRLLGRGFACPHKHQPWETCVALEGTMYNRNTEKKTLPRTCTHGRTVDSEVSCGDVSSSRDNKQQHKHTAALSSTRLGDTKERSR
ncbi:hypothetical protein BC939DRAFT_448593 [Gamsiella multidivaricata]|uniref:uncharacterized protein n=1 Tax=Gamsiella multidivaricata TaxID=101098 RepID=UPI00221E4F83|nr:uncharacterized protein BC939DRAFT_448593 [Gamsiella multidivaricata]KAI7825351.1 hypothetical protein BC939DRAFT_448593 [Gamsiella multidivaricata]